MYIIPSLPVLKFGPRLVSRDHHDQQEFIFVFTACVYGSRVIDTPPCILVYMSTMLLTTWCVCVCPSTLFLYLVQLHVRGKQEILATSASHGQ